ncbi:hypothetical protein [Alicyclobacillus acidocaldarius]|uniref:Uncharacterized protein n=1 Tax=Alicyclobacillus acidocaldarius subsp. acidocaldarius (strain ATCC 27009 / DSM 446 / BCRC 14685 / JCM 5260 / KCTC 1825 / NBRC 15652 / NCIMB 11725 / NRRL B-14509 / 104-IA) TaxID=521098 RepID=C8WPX6_ALIAD|nr:hypothetical protein [Alicyclobacillus acidocaldarius]ACV57080.1 hypothetical protein Aaci_0015 [Alicyclobacillus acidocaldarius subsp. acidocaldarius DSM 446]
MRISNIRVRLSADDLNSMIAEFAPDIPLRILAIQPDGVHGQFKFLMWNIDFAARPTCSADKGEISIEISARKLVNIPPAIVQMSLQEAMKDAPQGIEVLRQSLRLNIASLLEPLGIALKLNEFTCAEGALVIDLARVEVEMKGRTSELRSMWKRRGE